MFQVPGLKLEYSGKPDFNGQIELKNGMIEIKGP